jgi:hypothetical protein
MADLQSPRLIVMKAVLLLATGLLAGALVLAAAPSWHQFALLACCVWGFCRAYYFAFYVVEHWLAPGFRFAGLGHFMSYWWRRRRARNG